MQGGEYLVSGFIGGNNNIGFILVLFILLVIISCSCGIFGGSNIGGYGGGCGNVGGVGGGYGKGY